MIESNAKALANRRPPTRNASNRHRKQARSMGKFAESAAQHDIDKRGDGMCVAGRWISENFDEDDLVEFTRLVSGHKWDLIVRLSENNLKNASLTRHTHGSCACSGDVPGRGCCPCDQTGRVA